jgi:uncharacterized membrane protein YfcA
MLSFLLLVASLGAGFLGAILGLGGGIIVVPVLTLGLGVDIRYAIAASLLSIVATSSGAAASFLKDNLTNLRLAVFLEVGTVCGAIVGFLLSGLANANVLFLLFGSFLAFSALMMLRPRRSARAARNHPWAAKLKLDSTVALPSGERVSYAVENVPFGLAAMGVAGVLSALLGIGSGLFKVLAMDGAMKLPLKVSSATSNFMIGVTAAASAGAFFLRGDVRPDIAVPVSLGILVGAWLGARALVRLPETLIRRVFVLVLLVVSAQMIRKGLA